MSTFSSQLSLADAQPPSAAVEMAAHRVSAVSLEVRAGKPAVSALASEALPEGALVPSLTASNARDRQAVTAALKRVLDEIGRPSRIGLVVPDVVSKVSLVRFAQVPARTQDLDQLIRWQVRKAAPFPIEEAQVSYVPGIHAEDGQDFLVSMARRDIVAEYEAICTSCGAHAGIVDLSTFNVINAAIAAGAVRGSAAEDWLLVNVAADYASIALLRGANLIFFRNRASDADGTLADLVHQTAMYYEDRLGGAGFTRVLLSGASSAGARQAAGVDEIRRSLEERLGKRVETVDPRGAVTLTDRIAASPLFLDTLAPLVGLLMRDRVSEAAA